MTTSSNETAAVRRAVTPPSASTTLRRRIVLALVVLAIPIVPFVLVGELPGERWLTSQDDNALLFGATGASLLALDVLLPVPSSIVGTLLGARLGFAGGLGWTWLGLVVGNVVGFVLGRLALRRLAGDVPAAPTALLLAATRPVPIVAEAMTFAAGAAAMGWGRFLTVAVGANGVLAVALAGNGAALLPDSVLGPGLIVAFLIPVAAWGLWRVFARA